MSDDLKTVIYIPQKEMSAFTSACQALDQSNHASGAAYFLPVGEDNIEAFIHAVQQLPLTTTRCSGNFDSHNAQFLGPTLNTVNYQPDVLKQVGNYKIVQLTALDKDNVAKNQNTLIREMQEALGLTKIKIPTISETDLQSLKTANTNNPQATSYFGAETALFFPEEHDSIAFRLAMQSASSHQDGPYPQATPFATASRTIFQQSVRQNPDGTTPLDVNNYLSTDITPEALDRAGYAAQPINTHTLDGTLKSIPDILTEMAAIFQENRQTAQPDGQENLGANTITPAERIAK